MATINGAIQKKKKRLLDSDQTSEIHKSLAVFSFGENTGGKDSKQPNNTHPPNNPQTLNPQKAKQCMVEETDMSPCHIVE